MAGCSVVCFIFLWFVSIRKVLTDGGPQPIPVGDDGDESEEVAVVEPAQPDLVMLLGQVAELFSCCVSSVPQMQVWPIEV